MGPTLLSVPHPVAFIASVCLFAIVLATDAAAQEPAVVQVIARRVDGTTVAGVLTGIAKDAMTVDVVTANTAASAETAEPVQLGFDELLSLTFPNAAVTTPLSVVLEFANGDRLAVQSVALNGDALAAEVDAGIMLDVPLETLRGIAFRALPDEQAAMFLREDGADDLLLLTNGDQLAGQVLGMSDQAVTLDVAGNATAVPRSRVAAVSFSPELVDPAVIQGPRQIVQTAGGWLTVRELHQRGDGTWQATTGFDTDITWRADAVTRVLFAGERVEFLSEHEPTTIAFTPYLHRRWPLRTDRAVTGAPLRLAGQLFPKGLGVHSGSRVTYALAGRYESLALTAALDPSAGLVGNVEFVIELDGREAVRSGPVSAANPPLQVSALDVRDVQTLSLIVDFGHNGDIRDQANWIDALLVRRR